MFSEYEVVKANKKLSDKVTEGCVGTVLIIYNLTPPIYEVEFIDSEGNTLELLTVKDDEISLSS